MHNKYITSSKHEFNVRRVEELNEEILAKTEELKNAKGFMNVFRVRNELNKLYKDINRHGSEVLEYEYIRANERAN